MRVMYTALLCLVMSFSTISAQEVSEQEILNHFVRASDQSDLKNFEEAIPDLHWLLKYAPDFSKNIEIFAIEAFEAQALKAEDKNQKTILLDSMLIAYEIKREHFGLSDLDKNKLAFRYFKYFRTDKTKLAAGLKAFQEVYQTPSTVINNNLLPYMYMAEQYHKNITQLSIKEILAVYDVIDNTITAKKSEGVDAVKLDGYMSQIDGMLVRMTREQMTCDLISKFSGGLDRSDSVKVSKRIMGLSLDSKCGRTNDFIRALDILARNEPNPGLFKILAQSEAAAKNYKKAISLYENAFALETANDKKASIHFNIAQLYAIEMNKPEARKYALSALALDSEQAPIAYSFIGDLYSGSFDECSESDDDVENRAVYFAAYDMYEKAGNAKMMADIRLQFPTKSAAFEKDHYDNDPIEVGCWINVKTKIRTRSNN